MKSESRIPVTVITGFLGSGKTTLLNRMLSEKHGHRIAIIENEFGEISIDHELVVQTDEEIFEMNNGCLCCTVRGDLIRTLGHIAKRRDKFDRILIETTGLADPGPIAQTFFMDDDLKNQFCLDGIVTVVDALHLLQHLDDAPEAREQIAFADRILLNKIDMVSSQEVEELEGKIHCINAPATIYRCVRADVPVEKVWRVGGFNLDHTLEIHPAFLEPEQPFAWGGVFHLPEGHAKISFHSGHGCSCNGHPEQVHGATSEHEMPSEFLLAAFPVASAWSPDFPDKAAADARALFSSEKAVPVANNVFFLPDKKLRSLDLKAHRGSSFLEVGEEGCYALFTSLSPESCDLRISVGEKEVEPEESRSFKPVHHHSGDISSVGLSLDGDLDEEKVTAWMGRLLQEKGADIFRMKGVLSVRGKDERLIFQGVHMTFEAKLDRPWGKSPRHNALVFIGRKLDRQALKAGFTACMA